MSFKVTAGRIEIKSPSGDIVFDTDERLFIASDFKAGSVTRPARGTGYLYNGAQTIWSPTDISETVDLGAVHASANAVVGGFRVSGALATPVGGSQSQAANGIRNYGWFTAGGTYAHSAMPMYVYGTTWLKYPFGLLSLYTFRASGGRLFLDERTQGNPGYIAGGATGSINLNQEQITIDYKLFVGTYV